MSNNNAFTNLVGHLAKVRAEGVNRSRLSISKLISDSTAVHSPGSAKPPATHDLRSESLSSNGTTRDGLRFGSPSNKRSAAQGTSEWSNLLKQAASGGLASALGGGGGLISSISGIGGLVSSIVGLFGGSHKSSVPLSLFALSSSQNQELSVSAAQGSTQVGGPRGGIYGVQPAASSTSQVDHLPYQFQSAQIAQAVKQAILNSSSLNDVIAEI